MNAMSPFYPFAENTISTPRFREAGDLTLDLLYSDGRVEDRWLALNHQEFAVLWRLAQEPGEALTPEQLVAAMWELHAEPDISSLPVQMDRLRAKLALFGLSCLVTVNRDGSYALDPLSAGASSFRHGAREG